MSDGEERLVAGGFDCDDTEGELKAGEISLARAACYSRKSKRQRSEMCAHLMSVDTCRAMSAAENVQWSFLDGQHIPSCAAGALVVVSVCLCDLVEAACRIRVSQ